MVHRQDAPAPVPERAKNQRPVALLYGPGHVIVHGNPPFLAEFGRESVGLPAVEALLDLPPAAFNLMDLVYRQRRPLATRLTVRGSPRRLTVVPKTDIETGEVYGLAVRLAPEEAPGA